MKKYHPHIRNSYANMNKFHFSALTNTTNCLPSDGIAASRRDATSISTFAAQYTCSSQLIAADAIRILKSSDGVEREPFVMRNLICLLSMLTNIGTNRFNKKTRSVKYAVIIIFFFTASLLVGHDFECKKTVFWPKYRSCVCHTFQHSTPKRMIHLHYFINSKGKM